jgi:hypothetical protein
MTKHLTMAFLTMKNLQRRTGALVKILELDVQTTTHPWCLTF